MIGHHLRIWTCSNLCFTDLNLPLSGLALLVVGTFLHLKKPEGNVWQKLAKVDWVYVVHYDLAQKHHRSLHCYR